MNSGYHVGNELEVAIRCQGSLLWHLLFGETQRMSKQKQRKRHVPERTCVACRTKRPKRELIRIVRTPSGAVVVDKRQKQNGRGAYLCPQRACWERALRHGVLNHALRVKLTEDDVASLEAYAATLASGSE
jgi:hypothetical protein